MADSIGVAYEFFTYYAPQKSNLEIKQAELTHQYFAQIAPDGNHLVSGMLQQGEKPVIGQWLDVANVTRDLPARYFVHNTDFNTLVPGSLIQADRKPPGQWKELKKKVIPLHRFVYFHSWFFPVPIDVPWAMITDVNYFNDFMRLGILPVIFPGTTDFYANSIPYRLYYFQGTWAQLNGDVSKLKRFNETDAAMRIHYLYPTETYSDTGSSDNLDDASRLEVRMGLPGSYIIVAALLNAANEIIHYAALENWFEYT